MRSDYLSVIQSVTANNNGTALATLKPAVGQYWTPRFARVSIDTASIPAASLTPGGTFPLSSPLTFCQLYIGNTSNPSSIGAIVDVTVNGIADTTGIISGNTLQFGQTISALWLGLAAGTQCTLEIIGMSSDTPPSLGDSAPIINGPPFRHQLGVPDTFIFTVPFRFNNPGLGGHAVIVDPATLPATASLFLMELDWTWFPTVANGSGEFEDGFGSGRVKDDAGIPYPRRVNLRGGLNENAFQLVGNGLQWGQLGAAAANAATCIGTAICYATFLI